jgi:hypothetical protein
MALAFTNTKGKAAKNSHEAYAYKDGENTVRLFGGILPRYVYWVKGTNNKDIPIECLSFDRQLEKFTNIETDHVRDYFPDIKCGWAYSVNCLATVEGKPKAVVLNLKKKLYEQLVSAAGDLGLDPTDPDEGFDMVFKRAKTGPLAFNVEYTLSQLKLKKRPLTEEEREVVAAALDIDAKFVRQTPAEIKALLEKITKGGTDDGEETPAGVDGEAVNELG